MSWKSRKIQGVTYSLTHLDPFVINVTPKGQGAPTYKVNVNFGSHVFTRSLEPGDTPDFHVRDGRDIRCFCLDRHAFSLRLPALIRERASKKAYFGHRRNYLFFDSIPGQTSPYAAFFDVARARSKHFDVAMFVVSAYEKPRLPKTLPSISFATLIAKTATGETVIRPKK
jgi:hypothetical protein